MAYFLRNLQTSRVNKWRVFKIKNAKFSGYCFYMNTNITDLQICISVPSNQIDQKQPPKVWKLFLEISQNSQENTCVRVSFLVKLHASATLLKKTLAQVFSCEFCEISQNTFFTEHLATASNWSDLKLKILHLDWWQE